MKKLSELKGALKAPFPKLFKPMLATLTNTPPTEKGWLYEIKWDGYRALAFCNLKDVSLWSRNSKSFNQKFYPLVDALKKLNLHAVLDGEIVVLKGKGEPSFQALQDWRSEADGELVYYIFDVLWLDGYDLTQVSLQQRREVLRKLVPLKGSIRQSISFHELVDDLILSAKEMNLEGLMAKKADSTYIPNFRSKTWLKIKLQNRHEMVIGGYTQNENSPKPFSALLVGVYANGSFEYIGKVGTGFNQKEMLKLMGAFAKISTKKCPFSFTPDVNEPSRFRPNPPHAEVFWLQPKLVCEVSYTELSRDGVMRHPSYKGLRIDKKAQEVIMEQPQKVTSSKKSILKIEPVKKSERKTLLNPSEDTQVKIVSGHELKFNHLRKVFWPQEKVTKRDLLNYYYQAAPFIVPYLTGRPQSLNRFPNGIEGLSFYQKDVTKSAPEWIQQFPYHTSDGKDKNFLIVQDEADLLWMANLGTIEMNPWNSTVEKPDYPTWCIIDIDPTSANTFEQVIETAQVTKMVLDHLKIEGYCKTSGADGMHIYIPMGAKYTYDQCQMFGRMIATQVHHELPKITSIERYTDKRKNLIYVDFLQNRPKATLAAPYSVRPKPQAPVSMPLHWDEVKKGLKPQKFNIKNAIERMRSEGDLFKPVLGKGIDIKKALVLLK